jgi:3-oxoacyl-[acyl-carrier protein] reductase
MTAPHGLDLGIAGRRAIVCGASSGLGRACAFALARAGVDLVVVARTADALERTADEIRSATGVSVTAVPADTATEAGRQRVLEACPAPDILVNNGGGPPPGDFRTWDEAAWHDALNASMVAPIQMIRGVIDGMSARRWGRIVNITSYSAKLPLPLLGLSNGARSGLIGFASGLAREVAASGVTINNLLPGNFRTERLERYAQTLASRSGTTAAEVLDGMAARTPVGRVGRPEEFGAWCAFLASEHSGYVTAQNFVLDGGTYPGTF